MRFEWDVHKATENRTKHGVSFEEARSVFSDEQGLLITDPDHSAEEERFILMGASAQWRLLVVCHCYRADDELIRIISARPANGWERRTYRERWRR